MNGHTLDEASRAKHLALLRAECSTPELDALRAEIPTMRTSDLIGYMVNGEALVDRLKLVDIDDKDETLGVATAAALEIAEEIDRRIPVPR